MLSTTRSFSLRISERVAVVPSVRATVKSGITSPGSIPIREDAKVMLLNTTVIRTIVSIKQDIIFFMITPLVTIYGFSEMLHILSYT